MNDNLIRRTEIELANPNSSFGQYVKSYIVHVGVGGTVVSIIAGLLPFITTPMILVGILVFAGILKAK